MKKKLFALLIIIAGLYISCKKQNSSPGEIYGKWKLTETWADPGDGSGGYSKVKGDAKYITIDQSGKIEGEAMPEIMTYKILDSARMEITSKNYTEPLVFRYKVTAKTLELNPPCIEGCGFRFVRN